MPHSLFISDLHLSADEPGSMAAFRRFAADLAPGAEAIYILGDLFEYWAGDDDLDDTFHREVIAVLRDITKGGTRLYLMHGNRDLLMGPVLAEACRATLLPDPAPVDLYGTPTLLSHGDTLCTDDGEYQRYRASVHDAGFQRQFLAKPLAERKAFIEQLRARSMAEKQTKDGAIMDVSDDAVASLLRQHHYPRLIHGHTHRPARHEHVIDGHTCERWVLDDWHAQGSALRCDAQGCRVVTF
ncbi:MAG: UDP-2,3-diacylglucosamine diphosphatase [Nitrosomonadales bacterium]|nr:UDP-2,3-diacylglucosamine diphosphatase [Nitrosomonadales bacterium]